MNNLAPFTKGRRFGSLLGWEPQRLVDDVLHWEPLRGETVFAPYTPPIKIRNTDDGATLTVDMPGLAPDDVELTFQGGVLAISGKRDERSYAYRVTLGEELDPDRIEAALEHGVLTVHAHKKPEAKPRKIALGGAGRQQSLGSGDDES
jgi:HSP20 family molecular chaperone IbpA